MSGDVIAFPKRVQPRASEPLRPAAGFAAYRVATSGALNALFPTLSLVRALPLARLASAMAHACEQAAR